MPSLTADRHAPAGVLQIDPQQPARPSEPRRSSLLWPVDLVSKWAALVAVSALLLVGAWYAAAGESVWEDQRTAMSVGIGAFVFFAFVSLNLLLAGRRSIGLRRLRLLGELAPVAAGAAPAAAVLSSAPASDVLVGSSGLTRFHRADCPLAAGKDYPQASRSEHAAAGRMGCGVCRP